MKSMKSRLVLLFYGCLLPGIAWAHPGHGESGFASGLLHPLTGVDHILGMLAVGLWAARGKGMVRWVVPAAFLLGMTCGGFLGIEGILPSFLESAVAASVLVSALLVALAVRMPLPLQAGCAAFFALWHGMAHGAELPLASDPSSYASGFLLSTALLLGIGVTLGKRIGERDRWLGAGMAALALPLFWA